LALPTLFITGGSGFIGQAFIKQAVAAGHHVQVLVRSESAAKTVRDLQAQAIHGDLLIPGAWQQTVAQAEYIVHMAQPMTFGGRVTKARAEAYRSDRLRMESHLFNSVVPDIIQRIVYVGGTSYYGQQGSELKDETTVPNPRGWGPYIVEALESLKTYVARGLPIVEAFPGGVYGLGSWYATVLETLFARKRLVGLADRRRLYSSSIHVEDCARAILHLLWQGTVGQRYFLVDDRPNTNYELAQLTAQALGVPLRTFLVPRVVARMIIGPVITDSLEYENRLSNAKLHGTGFQFQFPTLEQGIPNVVEQWLKTQQHPAIDP
jgi:nucleoside-diphosphate-sugar epimerase